MPSRHAAAVALIAVVLLAGCSMLPGGGGDGTTTPTAEPPEHHDLVFAADTGGAAYEASIVVERNGSEVVSESVDSDGNGTYLHLGSLDEPGPYQVTVNTTLPAAGGGTRNDTFAVDGDLGNATAIELSYRGVLHSTVELPRMELQGGVGVAAETDDAAGYVEVYYHGERVAATDYSVSDGGTMSDVDATVANLSKTGLYRVAVNIDGEWTNQTLVVGRGDRAVVRYSVDGYLDRIHSEDVDSP